MNPVQFGNSGLIDVAKGTLGGLDTQKTIGNFFALESRESHCIAPFTL